jgi:hypothetical protein
VLTRNVPQSQTRRGQLIELQPLQAEFTQELLDIPVMPKTLLILEFMIQEQCVDLREMAQLVLSDLGATLQILRLAGRIYGSSEGRPTRIEDCISDLGLEACLKAVSAQAVVCDSRQHVIAEFWDHSRQIALHSRQLAEQTLDENPEEAYLTGLLHAIGLLPVILDWGEYGTDDSALMGLRFATRWSLPHCVIEFFREIHFTGYPALWSGIVLEAHHLANRSFIDCPFEQGLRPHLVRDGYAQPAPANYR